MRDRLLLECKAFDQLEECIREASCVPQGSSAKVCDQVRYLSSYLNHPEIAAKTILIETPYVDRHWLEEYSNYYATLLTPPRVKATRLHFFDESWTLAEFKQLLAASIGNREERTINDHYLGFSVIRPLPAAPIGRTVLRPYRGSERPDEFFLALKTYLRSGIPVVVRAKVLDGDLHAITLVGFREISSEGATPDNALKIGDPVRPKLRSRGIKQWYAHDDRLGPYARLGFASDGNKLELRPSSDEFQHLQRPMSFWEAIVPLYPKLRLTAEELVGFGLDLSPLVEFLSRGAEEHIYVEPCFMLGGEYVHLLYDRPLNRERIVELCTTLTLSRYVGVISWFLQDQWILDAVYDTTDLRRGDSSRPPMLALIPRNDTWIQRLEGLRSFRFGEGPVIG